MRRVVVGLRAHLGKEIIVRLVDEHRGGWGHLNFDHFRFHASRPAKLMPSMVILKADRYPHAGLTAEKAADAMNLPGRLLSHHGCVRAGRQTTDRDGNR